VNDQRLRDPEIFFAALLALTSVLVGSRALNALVGASAGIAFAPSLMARFGPSSTVATFSTFFVLLPTALAFIAIGIPFALRTIAAATRRELPKRDLFAMAGIAACFAALVFEASRGGSGLYSYAAMMLLSYWQLVPALARRGRRVGDWSCAAAGVSALGLAWHQWSYLGGSEASEFVAPTLLVIAFYSCIVGLASLMPAALTPPRKSTVSALVLAIATALWLQAPRLRVYSATGAEADQLEFAVATGAATLLLVVALAARRRA
jgi:hypothetical protein